MTPTEKQKTIAEQAVYGDLVITKHGQLTEMEQRYGVDLEPLPVLRPLKDLTKEITHRGYNNDEPFIPLVELAKMTEKDFVINNLHNHDIESAVEYTIMTDWGNGAEECTLRFGYSHDLNRFYKLQVTPFRKPFGVAYQQRMFDLLHLCHFDSRNLLDSNEAISTDEVNPYEVK